MLLVWEWNLDRKPNVPVVHEHFLLYRHQSTKGIEVKDAIVVKRIITEENLDSTRRRLNPEVLITPEGGDTVTGELLSVVGPFAGIPGLTMQALQSHVGTTFDKFFKELRKKSTYGREWRFLQSLPDQGSREWTMLALSLCAQFAVEASFVHPYLEDDARRWLEKKFAEQGVADHFNARWTEYRNIPAEEIMITGALYHRISKINYLRIQWIGDFPDRPSSPKYRLDWRA